MWMENPLAEAAWAHRLHAGRMSCPTEEGPPLSCPHAHLCDRAMPSACGSDLEAGSFNRTVSGPGLVMSPTTALESSISLVNHQLPLECATWSKGAIG
jgi:hypothetical protein